MGQEPRFVIGKPVGPARTVGVILVRGEHDPARLHGAVSFVRLGAWPCTVENKSFAYDAYGQKEISERHRHRYEFNNSYKKKLTDKGLRITGASPDGRLAEIVEIKDHPWFLGCQFHPEFKSRPTKPHPLFRKFIEAALGYAQGKTTS